MSNTPRYRKSDITIRSYEYRNMPVVCVKDRSPYSVTLTLHDGIRAHYPGMHDSDVETLTSEAWNESASAFWNDAQEIAEEIFGKGTKVYSYGRSAGWASIDFGRHDDVESWNAIRVSQWGRFERALTKLVKYHCSAEYLLDLIVSNDMGDGFMETECAA